MSHKRLHGLHRIHMSNARDYACATFRIPPVMAEASSGSKPKATAPTFSMRMVTYGIRKAFPSVQNISCEQLEKWRAENPDNLVCLVGRDTVLRGGAGCLAPICVIIA